MKRDRGITLIALVVTIVVLLILAGVSISMLTGENGIITQAQNSKEATEQARVEELVDLAVNSLIGENQGSTNGITPQMIAEEVNEMENRDDIYAEGSEFPTNIIFPKEQREVIVELNYNIIGDGIYSELVSEENIAPTDLFNIDILDLSAKTAKISGIKSQYCNKNGYNTETQKEDLPDTNYKINYKGITDTLVIPYQAEIDGEIYTITEVDLTIWEIMPNAVKPGANYPNIETIIYPNTITKIYSAVGAVNDSLLKKVVLSENLKEIPDYFFYNAENLSTIKIPDSVISIGAYAFSYCNDLTNITIPISVIDMGYEVFYAWQTTQTIDVPFKEGDTPEGWSNGWKSSCNATINYLK